MARIGENLAGRPFLDHLAGIHHDHALADIRDHAERVADENDRGAEIWMLTRDAGTQLRQLYRRRGAAPSWDALLPRYAELQIRVATDLEHFLRLGVPDVRPFVAVRAYLGLVERVLSADPAGADRLRALEPAVAGLADALADGLPSTLIHEEEV